MFDMLGLCLQCIQAHTVLTARLASPTGAHRKDNASVCGSAVVRLLGTSELSSCLYNIHTHLSKYTIFFR